MMHANSSQAGVDFDSAIDTQGGQQSVPMAPLMSNRNYRPRVLDSPSQRSLRSDSQKSSKYRPNPRKYNKN
jgi:phosphohistidine phosphatase SixA